MTRIEYFKAVTYWIGNDTIDHLLEIKVDELLNRQAVVHYDGMNPEDPHYRPAINRTYTKANYQEALEMALAYIERKGWKVTETIDRSGDYDMKDWSPKTYHTEDGYIFHRQDDGSYTDHPDADQADLVFESYDALAAYARS